MDLVALAVIVSYLGLTTLAGSLLARRSSGPDQWAAGGGQMGVLMIAVGIAGTRIGGVGTYGVAGDVITTGIWNLWYGVNTFLALALVGLFYAIPYRRLRLLTVAEIFRLRFGSRRCQVLTSLCVQTEYLIVNILEPFVIGSILVGITGMPFGLAVFIGAGVLISYTALGGLWGSAVTNLIHCVVMLVGLSLVFFVGVEHFGGWSSVVERVDAALLESGAISSESWWSFMGAGWMAVIAMFFSAAIHTPAASIYVNFSSAAKDEKSVVPSFLIGGAVAAVMPFLAGSIGILTPGGVRRRRAGLGLHPDHPPRDPARSADRRDRARGGARRGGLVGRADPAVELDDVRHRLDSGRRIVGAGRRSCGPSGSRRSSTAWWPRRSPGRVRSGRFSTCSCSASPWSCRRPSRSATSSYWKRTSERGAFFGMALGYGTGLLWYGAIRWATAVGFEAGPEAGPLRRLLHLLFVYEGEGIDPSYATTLIPLVAVPVLSLLWPDEPDPRRESFYEIVEGRAERDD